jgi:hypothetical protein
MDEPVRASLDRLIGYVEGEEFRGYDPYDFLNSSIPFGRLGKTGQTLAIQAGKRIPFNVRPWIGIDGQRNPKALGLFLSAYAILHRIDGNPERIEIMRALFRWLTDLAAPGFSGCCWGYPFTWASPGVVIPKFYPSVVVTSFAVKGIHAYFQATGDKKALDAVISASQYVKRDLPVTRDDHGICFAYSGMKRDACFNASLLGAEILAIAHSITPDGESLKLARQAVDFVRSRQKKDGRWNYSVDLPSGKEDAQIDFHQGFILESLRNIQRLTGSGESPTLRSVLAGAEFYLRQQVVDGERVKYRWPRIYPTDIHNQAQAIITFANLSETDSRFLECSGKILAWTIEHMQDPEKGYFYYRRGRCTTNRIPFMRWGQAWMLLALATYLERRGA